MTKKTLPLTAASLLFLMALLLIPGLGDKSIWGDEGWSIRFTDGTSPRETVRALTEDRHPPLYFLLLDGWRELAGEKETPLRMLAVYAALLTGAILYQLGKNLFDAAAGLSALLMFALMDKQVVFSQEVRHYTWFMLWTAASGLALWLYLEKPTFARALFFVAAVMGGLYTHSLYVLVIAGHVLYALLRSQPQTFLRLAGLYLLAGFGYSPWLMVFTYQYLKQGTITHTLPINWSSANLLAPEFLGRPITLTLGLLLLGAGSPFLKTGWTERRHAVLLPALGIVVPLGFILLVKDDGATLLNDRNLAMILPPMALLMGAGIAVFKGYNRLALVSLLLVNGLFTTDAEYTSPPWRPIAAYVAQHEVDHEPIVYNVYGEAAAMGYHLREEAGRNIPLVSIYDLDPNLDLFTTLRFEKLANTAGFWFIYWGEDSPLFPAFEEWGFRRTFSDYKLHFGNKIYMHRYDNMSLLAEQKTTYDGILRLHQGYVPDRASAGDNIYISLWWSAAQTPPQDYTISVILLHPNGTVASQHDSFPQQGRFPTSQWQPDQLVYDTHPLKLPEAGRYQIAVKVYTLSDGRVLPTSTNQEYFVMGEINVGEK